MTGRRVTDEDRRWMDLAIELAHRCPPAAGAYSVGAVLVDAHGGEMSRGYSRENDRHGHAEESALAKVAPDDPRLPGATMYATLEPCSQRRSHPVTCTTLILRAGVRRVVIAWLEPALFVTNARGRDLLEESGVTVVELPEFATRAREPNRHLPLS